MDNPYESPRDASGKPLLDVASMRPVPDLSKFFAWYFGAFILAALLWHLSALVRWFDILELPLSAPHFPLAGFFDPHDGMVNERSTFLYAIIFWTAVVPLALRLNPKRPLFTALAIVGICSCASVAYVLFGAMTSGPVF